MGFKGKPDKKHALKAQKIGDGISARGANIGDWI
jgi:hypothetical protein